MVVRKPNVFAAHAKINLPLGTGRGSVKFVFSDTKIIEVFDRFLANSLGNILKTRATEVLWKIQGSRPFKFLFLPQNFLKLRFWFSEVTITCTQGFHHREVLLVCQIQLNAEARSL